MFARWAWHHSPATKKRQRDDEFASRAIVLALLIGGVAVVFWQQLVEAAVFIGESDRLNTYLNMRLAEYDALRTYGRVPAWNPTIFGGFSVAALHWMNPGTDPIAFFLQLFPRGRVYQALGYVSIALVLAACATAYFYIRDLTGARIPAAIAGLCYGLSVFGIHRIAQIDNAYLTLVLLPAAMLAMLSGRLRTLSRRPILEIRTKGYTPRFDRGRGELRRLPLVCGPSPHHRWSGILPIESRIRAFPSSRLSGIPAILS